MTRKEKLENRIRSLVSDIHAAVKKGLCAADAKTRIEKAAEIQKLKKEIESYGYLVKILYNMVYEPNKPKIIQSIRIRIEVWQRKRDIPLKEQKKYDAWFLRIAGICQEDP